MPKKTVNIENRMLGGELGPRKKTELYLKRKPKG